MTGYHFEGDQELRTPLGHSVTGEPPKGPEYEAALQKVASELIKHLKKLKAAELDRQKKVEPPAISHPGKIKPRLFLTAVPEDLKRLRTQASELLSADFEIVPRDNPRDPRAIRDNIGRWLESAQRCVALLGALAGEWEEDEEGSVLFQLRAAEVRRVPTSCYVKSGLRLDEVESGA